MKAIVCADINWGIGKGTGMLFISRRPQVFQREDHGQHRYHGTHDISLPAGQKALPGRKNIVLTRDENWSAENVTVYHGIDELADIIENGENVFLMGGEAVYNELIDSCDEAYVTRVNADGKAEKFFPDLDRREGWKLVEHSAAQESNGYVFTFDRYVKK